MLRQPERNERQHGSEDGRGHGQRHNSIANRQQEGNFADFRLSNFRYTIQKGRLPPEILYEADRRYDFLRQGDTLIGDLIDGFSSSHQTCNRLSQKRHHYANKSKSS